MCSAAWRFHPESKMNETRCKIIRRAIECLEEFLEHHNRTASPLVRPRLVAASQTEIRVYLSLASRKRSSDWDGWSEHRPRSWRCIWLRLGNCRGDSSAELLARPDYRFLRRHFSCSSRGARVAPQTT